MKIVNGFQVPENIDEPGSAISWENTKLQRKITALSSTLEKMSNGLFPVAQFGTGTNYTQFEADGTMVFKGEAVVWDDMRSPATESKLGINSKPDFDYTELGLLFPQDDTSEKIYILNQIPHTYKQGSNVYLHIHWVQSQATFPVFKAEFRHNPKGAAPEAWQYLTLSTHAYTYVSGSLNQISSFPVIDGSAFLISDMLDTIIYRDDNVVTGDVLIKESDIHYPIDTSGSRSQFIK